MSNVPKIHLLVVLFALAATGCGGRYRGSTGTGQPTSETNIVVTPGEGYNGSSANLTGTPTAQGVNTGVTITLVDGSRELDVTLPITSLQEGAIIAAGSAGVYFDYSEGTGTSSKLWAATSGSITITSISKGKLNATVNGLQFSPTDVVSNNALGTFAANGTVANVPTLS